MGEAHGLDPLAAMRREVLDVEPGGVRDGLGHRALVETWRALARRCAGACGRDREACRSARLRGGGQGDLPCSSARCQRCATRAPAATPFSARSIAGASARSSPSLPKRCGEVGPGAHGPGRGARARPELLDDPLRHAHRRAAGAVEPVQLPAVPHEREGIAPDAVVGRLADGQAGGRGQRRVDRVAALLERPHTGARRGGVARRHERAAHDGGHPRKITAGEGRTGEQAVEVDPHAGVSTVRSLIPVAARAVPRARAAPRARGARASRAARRRRRARGSP